MAQINNKNNIVVVFDFDKTIIDVDSDNWVIDELGFTDLFNQLLPTMPWNTVMVCNLTFPPLFLYIIKEKKNKFSFCQFAALFIYINETINVILLNITGLYDERTS